MPLPGKLGNYFQSKTPCPSSIIQQAFSETQLCAKGCTKELWIQKHIHIHKTHTSNGRHNKKITQKIMIRVTKKRTLPGFSEPSW